MKTPNLNGFCDLVYESPNNWENRIHKPISLYLLWSNGNRWLSKKISEMNYGDEIRLVTKDIDEKCLATGLALIYPSLEPIEPELNTLPSR